MDGVPMATVVATNPAPRERANWRRFVRSLSDRLRLVMVEHAMVCHFLVVVGAKIPDVDTGDSYEGLPMKHAAQGPRTRLR